MKDPKTIEMFDSIPRFETYSRYNASLERIFKGKRLKNLVYSLKHPQKAIKQGILEEITKKVPDDDDDDDMLYGNAINIKKDDQPKNLLEDDDEIIPKQPKPKFSITNFPHRKILPEPGLDPFKYNPNYKSIYKNTPCTRIKEDICKNRKYFNNPFLTGTDDSNTIPVSRNKTKKIIMQKTDTEKKIKLKSLNLNNENEKKEGAKSLKTLPTINNKNNNELYDKNNHALRFSKYASRKNNIYNVNNKVSYLQPYDYTSPRNKTIDFQKMLHRTGKNFINISSLKVPSFYFYHPNYQLLEKKPLRVLFNVEDNVKENKFNKKFLVQKLWRSYDVKQEYQLIDNSKLNDEAVKLLNLDIK